MQKLISEGKFDEARIRAQALRGGGDNVNDDLVRQDVQKLISEGKFDEARIRAQALRGGGGTARRMKDIDKMLEVIEKAEKSYKLPSKKPNDGS